MNDEFYSKDLHKRAQAVEATFFIRSGLYLLGSLERGGTVYNQQLRAHNLVWALSELHLHNKMKINQVAVVGGGIAGLTTAACFLSLFEDVSVTLFEQLWDLCPLQQGSDNRWLHPKIYGWPGPGSRAPSASLPILNWSEGRASDVARIILREFSEFCDAFAKTDGRLTVFLGLQHFRINAANNEIDWVANKGVRTGAFFHIGEGQGSSAVFDIIVIAAGFGLEMVSSAYPTESYWRNEQLGQPILKGNRQSFLVSGSGDGALIDLCRLTIERYRQDTILHELFSSQLKEVEERLWEDWGKEGINANVFKLFKRVEGEILSQAKQNLSMRIRKDTRVALHISGKEGKVKTFPQIFGSTSSFLNRMMVFLLYRCGAFSISFTDLEAAVRRYETSSKNVLCRYGADPLEHLRAMFIDFNRIQRRLIKIKECQAQEPRPFWEPGIFRIPQRKDQP
jgi:hypothetical protein